MNPFHIAGNISNAKKPDMINDENESEYSPFMINRNFSYFQDTVLFANEMNRASHIDGRLQYDFLMGTIRPRKRFSKWMKKDRSAKIDIIKEYYGYSTPKAEAVVDLISDEMLKRMKDTISKGGKKK